MKKLTCFKAYDIRGKLGEELNEEIHCLENPGKIPLDLIEVRSGSYLEEDDVIRFQDRYGRS
ncbi:TPA: hypothetical protein RM273_001865 [Escherichia coli]|nr:hypothetical protein [Escherichia coli]